MYIINIIKHSMMTSWFELTEQLTRSCAPLYLWCQYKYFCVYSCRWVICGNKSSIKVNTISSSHARTHTQIIHYSVRFLLDWNHANHLTALMEAGMCLLIAILICFMKECLCNQTVAMPPFQQLVCTASPQIRHHKPGKSSLILNCKCKECRQCVEEIIQGKREKLILKSIKSGELITGDLTHDCMPHLQIVHLYIYQIHPVQWAKALSISKRLMFGNLYWWLWSLSQTKRSPIRQTDKHAIWCYRNKRGTIGEVWVWEVWVQTHYGQITNK